MNRKQDKKQNELKPRIITVVGYIFLTAILWTIPFNMFESIQRIFNPTDSSASDWISYLFIYGVTSVGVILLTISDYLKKNGLVLMNIVKWAVIGLLIISSALYVYVLVY